MKNYKIVWKRISKIQFPEFIYVDKIHKRYNPPENAVGCFCPVENKIFITTKHKRNIAIKIHEIGHWFFVSVYSYIDELWEVVWWHFGVRNYFIRNKESSMIFRGRSKEDK